MKKKKPQDVYTHADLQNWSEATRDVQPPIRLAVIGDPVAHSLSPQMQNAALSEAGIAMQYARVQLRESKLADALKLFRENQFAGLNVTLPHKERVLSLVNELDNHAKE